MKKNTTAENPKSETGVVAGFVYVNRYNLVDYVSAGLLKPALMLARHFPDFGTISPTHLPVLLRPRNFVSLADFYKQDEQNFPIELNIRLPATRGPVQVGIVDNDYQLKYGDLDDVQESDLCILIPFCLNFNVVNHVAFRDVREQTEFLSVNYDNADMAMLKTKIKDDADPDLRLSLDIDRLRSAIKVLDISFSPATAYAAANSMGGGLFMLDKFLSAQGAPDSLEFVGALLSPLGTSDALKKMLSTLMSQKIPSRSSLSLLPQLPSIARAVAHGELFKPVADNVVGGKFDVFQEDLFRPTSTLDKVLFAGTAYAIMALGREQSPLDRLGSIADLFISYCQQSTAELDDYHKYKEALTEIGRIINIEADMPNLAQWPPILCGLLLFLLRQDSLRVLSWKAEQSSLEFSDDAWAYAVFFAGLLKGLEAVSLSDRPVARYNWIHLDVLMFLQSLAATDAKWLEKSALMIGQKKLLAGKNLTLIDKGSNLSLVIRQSVSRETPAAAKQQHDAERARADNTLPEPDVPNGLASQNAVEIVTGYESQRSEHEVEIGQHAKLEQKVMASDAGTKITDYLDVRSVQEPSADQKRLAREICRLMKWYDCSHTLIDLTHTYYKIESRDGRHILEIEGDLSREVSVIWSRFLEHISSMPDQELIAVFQKAEARVTKIETV